VIFFINNYDKIFCCFLFLQSLERVQAYVSETMRVGTRFHVHDFSMFRNPDETYQMLEQLANFAAKKSIFNLLNKLYSLFKIDYYLKKVLFVKKIFFLLLLSIYSIFL
jgi:hypothetical protein